MIIGRESFFFSSRRRYTSCSRDWSSDVCSSDLELAANGALDVPGVAGLLSGSHGAAPSRDRSPPFHDPLGYVSERERRRTPRWASAAARYRSERSEERRVGQIW